MASTNLVACCLLGDGAAVAVLVNTFLLSCVLSPSIGIDISRIPLKARREKREGIMQVGVD
jgi:hypothetical protein